MTEKKQSRLYLIIGILALIGFLDATYLTATHYLDSTPGCGESGGCGEVTGSEFATIFGIPIALGGFLYYTTVIMLVVWWFDKRRSGAVKYILAIVSPAFLFSLWLVYLQLFVIEAICYWCMGSAASTTLIFLTGVYLWRNS